MKKALLFFSLLASTAYAQDCSKIFISEYVEGWGNNKALEIYNPTNAAIDLSGYFVSRYSNGSATATVKNSVQLSGTVPAHGVFVAVVDLLLPGTGQDAPIWDSLEARADGFFSPDYDVSDAFYWNGNDAILLAKGDLAGLASTTQITPANVPNFAVIDIFGKIGENPANEEGQVCSSCGGAWSSVAPYNTGEGELLSIDHSLIRKPTVLKGVTAPVSSFNALAEYDSIPAVTYLLDDNGDTIVSDQGNPILFGNWFSLGEHDCNCNPLSVENPVQDELVVFPNPVSEGVVHIKGATAVREVQVVNALGQTISRVPNSGNPVMNVRFGNNDRGVYILRIVQTNGVVSTKRIVVK